ncbi:carbohydrate porin [Neptunomonas qingdaonensis]|uniref:Porin-like glycoporin RafY n=1 Tax=Neptunomonas qingdaonensis TaxID=1045558 RepID=A0A1I2P223_9GAMM|nr:carbohydrate porin [Neptunomonas qingdaonensis]SFG09119.1 Porin-like glycoporin RafY [Neptunomonas qingdaonensis]
MKKSILFTAIIGSILTTSAAHAELSFDANLELDIDAVDTAASSTAYDQNGFVELNTYGKRQNGEYFVAAKGTIRLLTDGDENVVVRDAYIQLGNDTWDAQIGRFEAINLFPLAKDTLIIHAGGVTVYEANKVRGFAGDDGGQIALHFKASDSLKFEVDTIFGDDDTAGDNGTALSGIRPSVTLTTDAVTLTAGYERVSYDLTAGGDVSESGFAVTANFNVAGADINIAASRLKNDNTDNKVTSYAANMTYGNFGAGVIASEEDIVGGVNPEVVTTYAAYTLPLFDIENATVTFAGSYSTADNVVDDEAIEARMRFN